MILLEDLCVDLLAFLFLFRSIERNRCGFQYKLMKAAHQGSICLSFFLNIIIVAMYEFDREIC